MLTTGVMHRTTARNSKVEMVGEGVSYQLLLVALARFNRGGDS